MSTPWSRSKKARYLVIAAFGLTAAAAAAIVLIITWDVWRPAGNHNQEPVFTVNASAAAREVVVDAAATLQVDVKNTLKKPLENVTVQVLVQNGEFLAGDDGAVSRLDSGEIAPELGSAWDGAQAVIWRLGRLEVNEARNTSVSFKATGGPGEKMNFKILAYSAAETWQNCGFLRLQHCNVEVKNSLLGQKDAVVIILPLDNQKTTLTLGKGYNLVTFPQVASADALSEFWGQFTTPMALYLDAGQNWVNVSDPAGWGNIKPGAAMWLYHPDGGEVALPQGDALDINATAEIQLHGGWNQIGNPYTKRIQWQGDQILVKTAAESLSLNAALAAGIVKNVLGVTGAVENVDGLTDPFYYEMVIGRFWPAYSGLFIEASEAATLILPGKMIIAPGETLTINEKAKILGWINRNGLDICGNKPSNVASGNPLLNSATGEIMDQFDCVLTTHPDRPWN